MDTLFSFEPFVFSSVKVAGRYVEGLPLKTPVGDLLTTHGRVLGLFEMKYPPMFHLESIVKEVIPYFEQTYYRSECLSVHEHLLASVRETQNWLEKKILEYNTVDGIDFTLCFAVVWGSVLYVARCGGSIGLRLYRETTFGDLFSIDSLSGSSPIVSSSGYIQPHDTIVLYNDTVNTSHFPLTTVSLTELDQTVIYSRLQNLFSASFNASSASCVIGFFVGAKAVPAIPEDQIIFADVIDHNEVVLPQTTNSDVLLEEQLRKDTNRASGFQEQLYASPAALKGFSSKIIPRFSGNTSVFVDSSKKVTSFFTKKRLFVLGCMFLILFLGFIIAGRDFENRFKEEKQSDAAKAELLPAIQELYKQAQFYAELNPERAKNYLQEAREKLSGADPLVLQDPEIARLLTQINETYSAVTKIYELPDLQAYFDLSTVNAQAQGNKVSLIEDQLYVSDSEHSVVYQVGTQSRSAAPLIGPQDLENVVGADGSSKAVYAVSKKGIVKAQQDTAGVVKVQDASEGWGELRDVQVFADNLYVLDNSRSQIWKYIPEGAGFSTVRNYISSDSPVDLHDAVSFAIDGNVYVGKLSGEVIKFFQGKQDPFVLSGLETPLAIIRAVYTDDLTDYLYILDDNEGRIVVVLKKDGSYVSTYKSDLFKGATDLVIDQENKQMYVLNKAKIYRTEMREPAKQP